MVATFAFGTHVIFAHPRGAPGVLDAGRISGKGVFALGDEAELASHLSPFNNCSILIIVSSPAVRVLYASYAAIVLHVANLASLTVIISRACSITVVLDATVVLEIADLPSLTVIISRACYIIVVLSSITPFPMD